MPNIRAILRLFTMLVGVNLSYRFDILIWTLAEVSLPAVALAIWYAAARQNAIAISPQDTITYFLFIMFVRSATNTWVGFFLAREILTGEVVKFLVRPISVFWEQIADNLTVKILRLGLPALLLIGLVLWRPAFMSPSIYEPAKALLFVASLILGIILSFAFDAIFAMLAFWLEDAHEVIRFQRVFYHIATGIFIPYAVMPPLLFATLQWLPFRYMISVPVELLLGQIPSRSGLTMLGIQAGWIIVSCLAVSWMWRRGLKRYAVPGQ